MATTSEVKVLRDWSVTGDTSGYAAPKRCLSGTLSSGKKITTSPLRERVAEATYRTHSGSLYRLEGPPHKKYAAWCKERGIEIDPKDPIKIIGEAAK